jgi:hypothetical protein
MICEPLGKNLEIFLPNGVASNFVWQLRFLMAYFLRPLEKQHVYCLEMEIIFAHCLMG